MLFHTATDEGRTLKGLVQYVPGYITLQPVPSYVWCSLPAFLTFPNRRYLSEQCLICQLHFIFTSELWFCLSRIVYRVLAGVGQCFSLMCISVFHFFRCWQQHASSLICACKEGGAF